MEKTILVVEDDAGIRTILQDTLASQGYQVAAADNGVQGLEQMQQSGELFPASRLPHRGEPLVDLQPIRVLSCSPRCVGPVANGRDEPELQLPFHARQPGLAPGLGQGRDLLPGSVDDGAVGPDLERIPVPRPLQRAVPGMGLSLPPQPVEPDRVKPDIAVLVVGWRFRIGDDHRLFADLESRVT